jgi:hypothetical protein
MVDLDAADKEGLEILRDIGLVKAQAIMGIMRTRGISVS